jgi:hypothetical protein
MAKEWRKVRTSYYGTAWKQVEIVETNIVASAISFVVTPFYYFFGKHAEKAMLFVLLLLIL